MPANEETLSVSPDQTGDDFLGKKVCVNGSQNNNTIGRVPSDDDDEDLRQKNGCPAAVPGDVVKGDCCYKSLPVRDLHEQFMRSFVDLLLEDAVFEVRFG